MKKKRKREQFVSCIVAAAGKGERMGAGINKIFLDIDDQPVIAHTLLTLAESEYIDELIIVTQEKDLLGCKDIVTEFGVAKVKSILIGGDKRQYSVQNALGEVSEQADIVLVHDAARPLVSQETIRQVVEAVIEYGAAAVGVSCKSTLKQLDSDGFITNTLDRDAIYEVQTPQGFRREIIQKAYAEAFAAGVLGTDDCYLAERIGTRIKMVDGSYDNIKITTYDDLFVAEQILDRRK